LRPARKQTIIQVVEKNGGVFVKKLLFVLSLFCAFQWMSAKKGDPCTMTKGELTVCGTTDEDGKCITPSANKA